MEYITKAWYIAVLIASVILNANGLYTAKSLKVDCLTTGNEGEFRERLKLRTNAEDMTTIWLFKGEELSINFHLPKDAVVEVLDVRYSNDGNTDEISVSLDNSFLGQFETRGSYGWGNMWNDFKSSGPIGGMQELEDGKHSVTIKILEADEYGVEIDYIRLNVVGAILQSGADFICLHRQNGHGQ